MGEREEKMNTARGLSWFIVIAGIWAVLSPFILGFSGATIALWNAIVIGVALFILGIWAAQTTNPSTRSALDWVNVVLGLWLIASPFILGFSGLAFAMWNSIIVGLVVAILGLWAALSTQSGQMISQ